MNWPETRGASRSAVSRRFVAKTKAQMESWLGEDLSGVDLAVLMLDGVHIDDHVLLVALGIDGDGGKHVLGIREGATENATACTALLTDQRERGMRTDRTTLVVGSQLCRETSAAPKESKSAAREGGLPARKSRPAAKFTSALRKRVSFLGKGRGPAWYLGLDAPHLGPKLAASGAGASTSD